MRNNIRIVWMIFGALLTILVLGGADAARVVAKEKAPQVGPNDPTVRLYNLLDSKYNGNLEDYCVLAGVVDDPKNPGQKQQNVLRIVYKKDRAFGKLLIYVRSVGQLSPAQLKTYSPKQIYDFAETDSEKFTKTDPGPFGKPGDVYFQLAPDGGALTPVNITPDVQARYDHLLSVYLTPSLEKGTPAGSTP